MKRCGLLRCGCFLIALLLCVSLFRAQKTSADAVVPGDGSMADLALSRLLTIDGGAWPISEGCGHLQSFCCDDELNYMYFTFTDRLIKVDMRTNEVVGTMTGLRAGSISSGAHLGCLTYKDGWIYGTLEYKVEERWYIAAIDADKIVGDVNFADPGVMYAIHVPDVDDDFRDNLNAGEHVNAASSMGHRYGLGGIDGLTFGTLPGAGMDSKEYLLLSYAPYGNSTRYDNNNQIINVYDPDKLDDYLLPFTEDRDEPDGLRCEQQLFMFTGNQEWGVQNLEYDKDTGDLWMMCYGRPSGSAFPSGTMYLVDGSAALYMAEVEVGQSVPDSNPDQAAALAKAACYLEDGEYPQANHMTLKCICGKNGIENHPLTDYGNTGHTARICIRGIPAAASTGFISLGNDYFYVASNGSKTVDGKSCYWGTASLYHLDRDTYTFSKVTDPARLLLSYTMDAADTYEKDGQIWLKDVSGNGYDALVEGTYAAKDKNGTVGGALGFRGHMQGVFYDRVYASNATMDFLNDEIDDTFSYSFWVYHERETDRFTPVIGLYRKSSVQEGLYAGVFEWRYRSAPAISVHFGGESPEYKEMADGSVSMSRPGPGGGDGRTYIHGESVTGYSGKWLHYVVIRSGSTVTVYCNGEKTNSNSANISDSSIDHLTHFEMGGGVTKNWRDVNTRTRFSGMLDDVRLYSGALSLDQAKALYAAGPAVGGQNEGVISAVKEDTFADPYEGETLSEQENPIIHYRMDGADSLSDVSGNGIDGIATPWVTGATDRDGRENGALRFDGYQFTRPAKVTLSKENIAWLSAQLNGTGKLTVSFRMKAIHENGHRMTVLGIYDKIGRPIASFETRGQLVQNLLVDGRFAIGFTAAKPYVDGYCDEATYEQLCVTDTTRDGSGNYGDKIINAWYHVVGELDQIANVMRLYVDGKLVQETAIAEGTLGEIGYFLIGTPAGRYYEYENAANPGENTTYRQGWAMRGDYVGLVDDLRIYNRILTPEEVEHLYRYDLTESEYSISDLSAVNEHGQAMDSVPKSAFTAKVTVLKGARDHAAVIVAGYDGNGKMVEVKVLEARSADSVSCDLEARFDNENGDIRVIRAYLVTSMDDPIPAGAVVSWPENS